MKIHTLTQRQALDAMGSEATDAEADALIEILKMSPYADTREISDEEWQEFLDLAIAKATQS